MQMTDLSNDLREKLSKSTEIELPALISENVSKDGTTKWLFNSGIGQAIETVYIPETDRGTLCISSQVGCALDCSFCATGHQGFNRNLNADEIISQLYFANASLPRRNNGLPAITNVVFMGMGEPLANFKHVLKAIEIMLSDYAYGLSKKSNIEYIRNCTRYFRAVRRCNVSLAVSLHAPNDELRNKLYQ